MPYIDNQLLQFKNLIESSIIMISSSVTVIGSETV